MKKEIRFEEVGLELEETTAVNIRKQMQNNEDAVQALSAFAKPMPVELVRPPKPVPTMICLEIDPQFLTAEIETSKRQKTARELHWFDVVALFSVTALAFVKLGVLD